MSPEALSYAIEASGSRPVSGRTIRNIEDGHVPIIAIQFTLAQFFDLLPDDIWAAEGAPLARQEVAA